MITSLRLQNFRGFQDVQFEFEPGVNIIVGPNATGKTTILEGLLVVSGDSTFKGQDVDLVSFSSDWARVDVSTEDSERTIKLKKIEDTRVNKEYLIDDVKKLRLGSALHIPIVLFEPQDMNLLVGDPAGRRDFLDRILTTTQAGYGTHIKNYRRVLSQRNRLLKQLAGRPSSQVSELFVWDLRLSELGGVIHAARKQLVDSMNETFPTEYGRISGATDTPTLLYESSLKASDYTNNLLKQLTNTYEKDLLRGFTGAGPHRDDLVITIHEHDAKVGASRGETRSLLLALKLLELREVEKSTSKKPLLLLDDVFSELDGHRRRTLAEALRGYQTFITTTDADIVLKQFAQHSTVITTAGLKSSNT